jgi:hypothetical protein
MSEKTKVTETSYCSRCGWQEKGDEHDWEKHPATIHGDIERARERRYGAGDE